MSEMQQLLDQNDEQYNMLKKMVETKSLLSSNAYSV